MSLVTKTIGNREYMLFEGGYTKEQAKARVQELKVTRQKKEVGSAKSARTVPYEGEFAVFIAMNTPPFNGSPHHEHTTPVAKRSLRRTG